METIEEDHRQCLHCDYPIINKRTDAIYCSIKCGYTYRNQFNKWINQNQNEIVKEIRNNDQVIQKLINRSISEVSFDELKNKNFNFNYYTKSIIEENSIVGSEFFRYKILRTSNNNFKIYKK